MKEVIRGDGYKNQFDVIAGRVMVPVVVRGEEDSETDLEKFITRSQKRQLLDAERRKILTEIGKPEAKLEAKDIQDILGKKANPKRFVVNDQTGKIDVDEEDGEYTLKEALAVSASVKSDKGDYAGAIKLLQAAKDLAGGGKDGEGARGKKEWVVEDDGEMVLDPDNGEMTYSEARGVSASRQRALALRTEEPVTKDKLDLMKRDMTDAMTKAIENAVGKVKEDLHPKDNQPAFVIDEEGKPKLNPKASLTVMEYLIWQQSQKSTVQSVVTLPDGKQMDGQFAIEWSRHGAEQKRKDDMNSAVVGFIGDVREKLPDVLEAFKNVGRSKEVEESMQKGGWLGGEKGGQKGTRTANCPNCNAEFTTTAPSLVTCPNPKCLKLIVVGSGNAELDKAFSQSITQQVAQEIAKQKEASSASQKESGGSGALSED